MSNYPTAGNTDQYGNPIGHTGAGAGAGYGGGHTAGGHGHPQEQKGIVDKIKENVPGGHKDQYSSQPGYGTTGGNTDQYGNPIGHTGAGAGAGYGGGHTAGGYGHPQEQKGIVDKIKENIPGGHKDQYSSQPGYGTTGGNTDQYGNPIGHTGAGAGAGYGGGHTAGGYGHSQEQKGIMEKIKENVPVGHKDQNSSQPGYGTTGGNTDQYGNPIGHTGAGAGAGYGGGHTTGHGTEQTGAGYGTGTGQQQQQGHGLTGMLHRSGSSSSSSSSEDDGMGGRRKKGLKEKIKEKIPGGRKDQSSAQPGYGTTGTTTTTAGGAGGYGHPQEKKGMMEKIKEKLPGQHN